MRRTMYNTSIDQIDRSSRGQMSTILILFIHLKQCAQGFSVVIVNPLLDLVVFLFAFILQSHRKSSMKIDEKCGKP